MLRRQAREEGFTLIELVISITILTIISAALIGMLFAYLRVSNETNTRLNESTDQQFVSAYWQQDVSSLGSHGVPVNGLATNSQSVWVGSAPGSLPGLCAGHSNAVVSLAWSDYQSVPSGDPSGAWTGATSNAVVYYTKVATNSNGTTQQQLWRQRCGGTVSNIIVARHLTAVPTVSCADSSGANTSCTGTNPFPATVSMVLTIQDLRLAVHNSTGYTTTLTAERRQG